MDLSRRRFLEASLATVALPWLPFPRFAPCVALKQWLGACLDEGFSSVPHYWQRVVPTIDFQQTTSYRLDGELASSSEAAMALYGRALEISPVTLLFRRALVREFFARTGKQAAWTINHDLLRAGRRTVYTLNHLGPEILSVTFDWRRLRFRVCLGMTFGV